MPDFSLVGLLGFAGTGFAATLAVLALFWKADDAFSDEFRDWLSKILQGIKIETSDVNWPKIFSQMFDRVFGEKHLSWMCFGRSCLASVLVVLVLSAITHSIRPEETPFTSLASTLVFLMFLAILNPIPDYLSLLESRWIIRVIARHRSTAVAIILMIIDAVVTILIFFIGVALCLVLLSLFINRDINFFILINVLGGFYNDLINNGIYLKSTANQNLPLGLFFYSTLFTSAWIWLFVTGWFVIRSGARFQRVLAVLQFALPIKTKPIRAIGEVAALVTASAFVVLGIFGFDFGPTKEVTVGLLVQSRP